MTILNRRLLPCTALALILGCGSTDRLSDTTTPAESGNGRNAGTIATSKGKPQGTWKQGQLVELTGRIHPARTEAKYFIATDDFGGVSVRSDAIDKLDVGTLVWVRGTVEYVHYPKPRDYHNDKGGVNYGVGFPQTICYINVSEHRVISPKAP